MSELAAFTEQRGGGARRALAIAAGLILLLGLGYFVYRQMTAIQGVGVEAPPTTAIDMLPPPPPPPPPPPEPQEKPPEPTEQEVPTPSPEPAKAPDAPAPVTIAGPAQAGGDSYGLQSGSGTGSGAPSSAGTCVGANCGGGGGGIRDAFYRRYLSGALQQAISRDDRVNRLVFTADFEVRISPTGQVDGVTLRRSSGKDDRDRLLQEILRSVRGLDPPPVAARYPVLITVRGRRSL